MLILLALVQSLLVCFAEYIESWKMNSVQIDFILKNDKFAKYMYLGIIPSDSLAKVDVTQNGFFVVNIDPSYSPGSHWICVYLFKGACEVFDSLGINPLKYGLHFHNFFTEFDNIEFSEHRLQDTNAVTCGIYVLFYCMYRSRGYSLNFIIEVFSKNVKHNDELMMHFLDNIT